MRPIERSRRFRFAVYDIETKGIGDLTFHCIGFFDGHEYWYFENLTEFFDHVFQPCYHGYRIFAHFGGRFDVHFLFDWLRQNEPDLPLYIICSGSCVISLTVKLGKHYWRFCDSYRLLPASLKRLGDEFETKHRKLDFAPLEMTYNRNDCLCLYEVLTQFFDLFDLTSETLASHALRVFRRYHLTYDIFGASEQTEEFVRSGYFGGRCEIFRWNAADLNKYDFNSMYPAAMLQNVPVYYLGESRQLPDHDDQRMGFFLADVHYPEDSYLPVLPVLAQQKLFFPTGYYRGVFADLELREAINQGAGVRIISGRIFLAEPLLRSYAETIYQMKLEAERNNQPGKRYVCKILLNALYGKWGQKREQRMFLLDDGTAGLFPLPNGLAWKWVTCHATHIMPHIAAAITSRARLMIWNSLQSCCAWYTDTDSLFTSDILPVSDEIGSLKLEGTGVFRPERLKEYSFSEEEESEVKLKGIPRNERGLQALYMAGWDVPFDRMAGFLESIRTGMPTVRYVHAHRRMNPFVLEKRCRIGDNTRPWRMNEILEM